MTQRPCDSVAQQKVSRFTGLFLQSEWEKMPNYFMFVEKRDFWTYCHICQSISVKIATLIKIIINHSF